ncbi:peroxisomal ATPase PEX1 [Acrasis kona]|uniref:Peroxisomal ATPase PEX1 n=1 Tax=Acrasis kona TaxID=1008807 RepID=A0AAW2ZSX6_9EUKA
MSLKWSLEVKRVSERNCHVILPRYVYDKIDETFGSDAVIKLTWKIADIENNSLSTHKAYVGRNASEVSDRKYVEIGSVFAQSLGIKEGTQIQIEPINVEVASRAFVEPHTANDSEILEYNQASIEEHLLSQARVVYPGLVFPLWIHSNISISVHVLSLVINDKESKDPDAVAKLNNGSELIESTSRSGDKTSKVGPMNKMIENDFGFVEMEQSYALQSNLRDGDIVQIIHIVRQRIEQDKNAQASIIPGKEFEEKKSKRHAYAMLKINKFPKTSNYQVAISQNLKSQLECSNYSTVHMKRMDPKSSSSISRIHLRRFESSNESKVTQKDVKSHLLSSMKYLNVQDLPISNESIITIKGVDFIMKANAPISQTFEFNSDHNWFTLQSKASILDESTNQGITITEEPVEMNLVKQKTNKAYDISMIPKDHAALKLKNGLIYINGDAGMGKTFCAKQLCNFLQLYSIHVSCSDLIGDRTDTLIQKFRSYARECSWHSPAVLVLDDLDKLIPPESDDPTQSIPDWNSRVLRSVIRDVLREVDCAIVTSKNSVIDNDGVTIDLLLPDQEKRCEILKKMMNKMEHGDDDLAKRISARTDAFSPRDLSNLVRRASHLHYLKNRTGQPSYRNYDAALVNFVTINASGVKLYKPPHAELKWEHVGGMSQVKKTLRETLEFPIKHASLFRKAPINLRSGLLLYGYPGCGKSYIVNCLANLVIKDGVKFMMVKGPELLNKYIGASEQSVRDVFASARSVAPCIIFFDEFDALAQQRGTGDTSTGVTDRVVNQLLCELDGVEGRTDQDRTVYVIAATSRPDMIDAALLRPGRLDKSLLCDMPNEQERFEILSAHCKQSEREFGDDVLRTIAERTEHYTGADLQALWYTAKLTAAHAEMNKEEEKEEEDQDLYGDNESSKPKKYTIVREGKNLSSDKMKEIEERVKNMLINQGEEFEEEDQKSKKVNSIVKESHMFSALNDSRPSLGERERLRFDYVYKHFGDHDLAQQELLKGKKRATLA